LANCRRTHPRTAQTSGDSGGIVVGSGAKNGETAALIRFLATLMNVLGAIGVAVSSRGLDVVVDSVVKALASVWLVRSAVSPPGPEGVLS